jgi:hypothetical protein
MAELSSTLPDDLVNLLSEKAEALAIPKSVLLEKALRLYLEFLDKAEYVKSYKRASSDSDVLSIAEEGVTEYLKNLPDEAR